MPTVQFSHVDELNQTVASHSTRVRGGDSQMVIRSRTYPETYGSQNVGGVMAMGQSEADFDDEEAEFRKVYTIILKQGGFGKTMVSHPFMSAVQTANRKMLVADRLVHAASNVRTIPIFPATAHLNTLIGRT